MKRHTLVIGLLAIAGLGAGFLGYSGGRAMAETVDLSWRGLSGGLMLGLAFPFLFATTVVLALAAAKPGQREPAAAKPAPWRIGRMLVVFAGCALAGNVTAEAALLADEARFATEVAEAAPTRPYTRERAWPNQTCALVFVPGQGIHATD